MQSTISYHTSFHFHLYSKKLEIVKNMKCSVPVLGLSLLDIHNDMEQINEAPFKKKKKLLFLNEEHTVAMIVL